MSIGALAGVLGLPAAAAGYRAHAGGAASAPQRIEACMPAPFVV